VDAVEIDPAILALGKSQHPERPYDSAQVAVHLTDARNFLKRSQNRYDLILFGALDSHTATWNFGDGTTTATNFGAGGSAGLSSAHSYAGAGNYTVTLTVTDDDGGAGQATTRVAIQTPQAALTSISGAIQKLSALNDGQRNSLNAKVNAATASLNRGDTKTANNQLNALLNELQALVNSGRLSAGDVAALRNSVHAVQAAIGTYNRFLEWWPLGA